MKFLHTGDWHIGKKLNGYDLLEEQQDAFEKLCVIADKHQVNHIVIAGDLYDRSVPSIEAVEVFNQMMLQLNVEKKYPVLAISGNHDSSTRLATGSQWFAKTGFHLHTTFAQAFEPVIMGDTQFFLLPFFDPFEARRYFEDETIKTIQQAMDRVIAEMKQLFDPEKSQVLVAHFFAAGSSTSDSETSVTVGGLDNVSVQLLEETFDYVALGHLHNRYALKHETVRYSGTLLKYSLSEVNQTKGVWIVDMTTAGVEVIFEPITPLRDVQILEESFATLMSQTYYEDICRENYIGVRLTDKEVIPNVMNQLSSVYPKIIQLERVYGRHETTVNVMATSEIKKQDPLTLFGHFFEEVTGESCNERQEKWLQQAITAVMKGEN